jgi:hypothetical protein
MTNILLRYVLRTFALILGASVLLAFIALGEATAIGVFVGGILGMTSGGGLVYVVGALLEPNATRSKTLLFTLMFGKLLVVGFGLWLALTVFKIDGLGVILGIGLALVSLMIGVNRGSSSPEGKRAMAEDEARIGAEMERERAAAEDLEDKGSESS